MDIKFSPPDIGDAEINGVIDVLKSGWITTGQKTKLFEKKLAEYCRTPKAAALNSATVGLELILRILGIGKGDEVITSAYTYTASASVIEHVGATIVLCDTAFNSYEMDYDKLGSLITERTKAVIPVDIGGKIADYNKVYEVIESKKSLFHANNEIQKAFQRVMVIADAAHSFGAKYRESISGNIADFTSFSFHAVKNLTTAEGGAVTWREIPGIDSETLYKDFMLWSLHGQSKDALSKTKSGAWEYDVLRLGHKCNMTDIAAAIGLAQLNRYDEILARRREIIERYDKGFQTLPIQTIKHFGNGSQSCGHLYLTRVYNITPKERNEIIFKMAENGIACNVHYKPLPLLTAYRNLGFKIEDFPNAYLQYSNEISLPLHTLLTNEEVEYIIENYVKIVKEYV